MLRGFEKLKDSATIPTKGTRKSAGNDFYVPELQTIAPGEIKIIPTHITAYMLDDEFLDLRLRSSIAKKGLILLNGSGVIDSDYYGNDIGFLVMNLSKEPIVLEAGDRIGQGIFSRYLDADRPIVQSEERSGGFGSTGK